VLITPEDFTRIYPPSVRFRVMQIICCPSMPYHYQKIGVMTDPLVKVVVEVMSFNRKVTAFNRKARRHFSDLTGNLLLQDPLGGESRYSLFFYLGIRNRVQFPLRRIGVETDLLLILVGDNFVSWSSTA